MRASRQDRVVLPDGGGELLSAFADALIPAAAGFPGAAEAGVVEDFVRRYVDDAEPASGYFPGVTLADVSELMEILGTAFPGAGDAERTAAVRALESEHPELFGRWRACIYYGYYSRPLVVEAIRANLDAGRDYHGAPQPYGYPSSTEEWDAELLAKVGGAGYVATDEVVPLDRARLDEVLAAQEGTSR